MALFDDQIRTDPSPRRYTESFYTHLNRRHGDAYMAIRNLLDQWFDSFPDEGKSDILGRFRSQDTNHFHSAFLELFTFSLAKSCGYKVQVHPTILKTGARPDFLLVDGEGREVYAECVVITEISKEEEGANSQLNFLFDELNKLRAAHYYLFLDHDGTPNSPIPLQKWRTAIQAWIDSLSYTEVLAIPKVSGFHSLPTRVLIHDGFKLTVRLCAIKPEAIGKLDHRPIGSQGAKCGWVNSRHVICSAIRKKASKYGQLDRPYIVVINCIGEFADPEEMTSGIFGADGVWKSGAPKFNTRLSAVLAFYELLPWTVSRSSCCFYENPAPLHKYIGSFNNLTVAKLIGEGPVFQQGSHPSEFLGLDLDWPD